MISRIKKLWLRHWVPIVILSFLAVAVAGIGLQGWIDHEQLTAPQTIVVTRLSQYDLDTINLRPGAAEPALRDSYTPLLKYIDTSGEHDRYFVEFFRCQPGQAYSACVSDSGTVDRPRLLMEYKPQPRYFNFTGGARVVVNRPATDRQLAGFHCTTASLQAGGVSKLRTQLATFVSQGGQTQITVGSGSDKTKWWC